MQRAPDSVDIVVLGAGFGGALTALILRKIGFSTVLIDRGAHPRFAIGESSTPIADLVLGELCRKYNLDELSPLCRWGTWKKKLPHITCGRKRGFSYFKHQPHQPFSPSPTHENELLVAASSDDDSSDTHWLRSDVDRFFTACAQAAGVEYWDHTQIEMHHAGEGWRLKGDRLGQSRNLAARFLIDATGNAQVFGKYLNIPSKHQGLRTDSWAVYAHFENLPPWRQVLSRLGGCLDDHPFPCDHAAQHHILHDGWMWQLRFDNGVTSAGVVFDQHRRRRNGQSPQELFNEVLRTYPSLEKQFADARMVAPAQGLTMTGRLQRHASLIAGPDWALLPHTAGFIDPLHSTGIAHTLCGVERLTSILQKHWRKPSLAKQLKHYAQTVDQEIEFIDELVSVCYLGLEDFPLLAASTMLYFTAAIHYEQMRTENSSHTSTDESRAFLCADDATLRGVIRQAATKVAHWSNQPSKPMASTFYLKELGKIIKPYNRVGLCNPEVGNMYQYTAAKKPKDFH